MRRGSGKHRQCKTLLPEVEQENSIHYLYKRKDVVFKEKGGWIFFVEMAMKLLSLLLLYYNLRFLEFPHDSKNNQVFEGFQYKS